MQIVEPVAFAKVPAAQVGQVSVPAKAARNTITQLRVTKPLGESSFPLTRLVGESTRGAGEADLLAATVLVLARQTQRARRCTYKETTRNELANMQIYCNRVKASVPFVRPNEPGGQAGQTALPSKFA